MLYSLETLDSLLDFNTEIVQNIFKKTGGINPAVVGYSSDNRGRIFIPGRFRNDDEKKHWIKTIPLIFGAHDVDKYVAFMEGWMAIRLPDDPNRYVPPSQCADRRTVIVILAVNKLGNKSRLYTPKGKTLELLPDMGNYTSIGGAFAGLLPPPNLSKAERERLAKEIQNFGVRVDRVEKD